MFRAGLRRALAVMMIAVAPMAGAAGFDCNKASSRIERQICSDPLLGRLDEAMVRAYATARRAAAAPAVVEDLRRTQRQWLALRDRCSDTACVGAAYLRRLTELRAVGDPLCAGLPDAVPGAWRLETGTGPFEVVELAADGGFASWLHQRPEIVGAQWHLRGCALTIQIPGEAGAISLELLDATDGLLLLRGEEDEVSAYARLSG